MSRELFGPLIEHHKAGLARYRGESRERRGAVALLLRQSQQEFDRAAWSTWLAWGRPRERGPGISTHWQDAEAHLGLCIERLAEARDRLPDLSWSLWMARDHARMLMHDRALLAAGAREIPPLPPGIVAEREAAEARYRRMLGNPKLELTPESSPPGLLPKAARPGSGPARRRGLPNTRERAW